MRVVLTRNTGATDYWRFPWVRFPDKFVLGIREYTQEPLEGRKYPAIMLTPGAETQVYFPLEDEPGISETFGGISDASAALDFANRFGELGLSGVIRYQARYNSIPQAVPYGEEIRDWLFEAGKLHRFYCVWNALRDENHSELRRIIQWEHSRKYGLVVTAVFPEAKTAIANAGKNTQWLRSWSRGDVVGPAKLYLADQFNENMYAMASPMLLLDFKGLLRPYNSTASLLGALWLEVGQLASGVRKQLPCESCGKVMDVTGLRSDKRKHDKCVLREKMARYRSAKRETENGKTKTRKR